MHSSPDSITHLPTASLSLMRAPGAFIPGFRWPQPLDGHTIPVASRPSPTGASRP
jgi:hypothetical protein